MGRMARGNEEDAIQAQPVTSLSRDDQVAAMEGVERSAEQANPHHERLRLRFRLRG
jgi:hypothetical protein